MIDISLGCVQNTVDGRVYFESESVIRMLLKLGMTLAADSLAEFVENPHPNPLQRVEFREPKD